MRTLPISSLTLFSSYRPIFRRHAVSLRSVPFSTAKPRHPSVVKSPNTNTNSDLPTARIHAVFLQQSEGLRQGAFRFFARVNTSSTLSSSPSSSQTSYTGQLRKQSRRVRSPFHRLVSTFARRGRRGRRETLLRALGRPNNTQTPASSLSSSRSSVSETTSVPQLRRGFARALTPFVSLRSRRTRRASTRKPRYKVHPLPRSRGVRKALTALSASLRPGNARSTTSFSVRLHRALVALRTPTRHTASLSGVGSPSTSSGGRDSRDQVHRNAYQALPRRPRAQRSSPRSSRNTRL